MSSSRAVTPRVPDRSRREPGLCPGELRVYVLDLSLLTRCHQEFVAVLSPDERDRAGRLVHPEARQRFEMVRGALRRILADLVGQEPDQLRFAYGQYAKPYLVSSTGAGDRQPRFNVSHSGNVGVIAVSPDADVGVDVERIRRVKDARRIARRFFCPAEADALEQLSLPDLDVAFLRCWTRKEAYIKGIGLGLHHPLCSFAVSLCDDQTSVIHREPGHMQPWVIAPLQIEAGYVAAISTPVQAITDGPQVTLKCNYVPVSA